MTTTVGSGIGSSIGIASESTWGTFATPTKWIEFDSEGIEWKPKRMQSKGLANGLLVQRNSTRVTTTSTVEGDLKCQMFIKNMGLLIGGAFGSIGTTTPVQQGSTAAYLQSHAYAQNFGQSLTVQVGRPDLTGTIHQFNYEGCKVTNWTMECGVDEFLECTYSMDAKGYDQTNAYALPTYATGNSVFAFNNMQFRMGTLGNEVVVEGIRKVNLGVKRPLKVDNFYADGTGLKQQQVQNGFSEITLTLDTDYLSDTLADSLFAADTAQSIILDFINPTQIAAGVGSKTITGATTANPCVITATSHGFSNGQVVYISGITASAGTAPSGYYVISNVTTNTFQIGYNGSGFTYGSGGTAAQNYYYQFSVAIPNLRWNSEPPKVGGPEIIQPSMQLVGLYNDSNTPISATYVSTDTTL